MRCMDIIDGARLCARDFSNGRYTGLSCFQQEDAMPVLLMASRSADPPHYLVTDGIRTMYYLRYSEAVACCKRMRLMPSKR